MINKIVSHIKEGLQRISFCTVLLFAFPIYSQSNQAFQFSSISLEMSSGGSKEVQVDVFLPKNNHLYVKNLSALSFNKPTLFAIPESSGFAISIKEEPKSYKKGEDMILSGKGNSEKAGSYILTLYETKGRSPANKEIPVSVEITTQWCDSSNDTCFEPKKLTQKIKIKINEDKKIVKWNTRSGNGVKWVQSYNEALSQASSSGKNIFVVITAPDWCGYCIRLEKEVFSKENVINRLNDKFIPLQILDSNTDKKKFNFSGYPTMLMTDQAGKTLSGINARTEDSFLSAIKTFEKSGVNNSVTSENNSPSNFQFSIKMNLQFSKSSGGVWVLKSGKNTNTLQTVKEDENYTVLQDSINNQYYAIPKNGSKAFYLKNNQWEEMQSE